MKLHCDRPELLYGREGKELTQETKKTQEGILMKDCERWRRNWLAVNKKSSTDHCVANVPLGVAHSEPVRLFCPPGDGTPKRNLRMKKSDENFERAKWMRAQIGGIGYREGI
jgi:hypothetical protein